jgi:hypothetical protein
MTNTNTNTMMACGHVANAVREDGSPACAIHAGLTPDAYIVVPGPDLEGRLMRCPYCKKERTSDPRAPYFEHRPDAATDSYYCGCRGWD